MIMTMLIVRQRGLSWDVLGIDMRELYSHESMLQRDVDIHQGCGHQKSEREKDQQSGGLHLSEHRHEFAARLLCWHTQGVGRSQEWTLVVQDTAEVVWPLVWAQRIWPCTEASQKPSPVSTSRDLYNRTFIYLAEFCCQSHTCHASTVHKHSQEKYLDHLTSLNLHKATAKIDFSKALLLHN